MSIANDWHGIGRWAKPVELRATQSGKMVASTTIAVNEKYGEKESTLFLPVVMWGPLGENVANYCADKGRLVAVAGRLQQREYQTADGTQKRVVELVATDVRFLDKPKEGAKPQGVEEMGEDVEEGDVPF